MINQTIAPSNVAVMDGRDSTRLTDEQRRAIDPNYYVWVTASAGSGKTKVLIDRILYLLLSGQKPHNLLVITFTRAASAEIKNRLNKKLAEWTVKPDKELEADIKNIVGEQWEGVAIRKKMTTARGLFLQMMDEKQNLVINTIHGFCQQLLSYFPLESGVPFAFQLADEDEAKKLLHNAMETTLLRQDGEVAPLLSEMKRYWQNDSALKQKIEVYLSDPLALENHQRLHHDNLAMWQKQHGWLSAADMLAKEKQRAELLASFTEQNIITKDGKINKTKRKKFSKQEEATAQAVDAINAEISKATIAGQSYIALALAIKISDHYKKIKFANGLLDYNDLIIKAANLLADKNNIHPWVQYKMAGAIKHLLLDEAQDTSPSQWQVIKNVVDGFTMMQKKRGDYSFLIVGDGKQSIFAFQGAEIKTYHDYKILWDRVFDKSFLSLLFDTSFRSGKNILEFVDKVFAGSDFRLSLGEDSSHRAHHQQLPSQIMVKNFVAYEEKENHKSKKLQYIESVAQDIKNYIDHGVIVENNVGRAVKASDIMVLIKERKYLQPPLVAALKKIGVMVAGRDRIILKDEWLVKDMINLGQFALMPRVDFYLANLLLSPFCNLSYDELETMAINRTGSLYQSLVAHAATNPDPWWKKLLQWLDDISRAVNQKTAFEFFYDGLQQPCPHRHHQTTGQPSFVASGRAMLLARWGMAEGETLNIFFDRLLDLEKKQINNLAMAIDKLLNDNTQIKKDAAADYKTGVRIITCHGAKGLEAPIVFLLDYIPDRLGKKEEAFIREPDQPILFLAKKEEREEGQEKIWQQKKDLAMQEEHRLLYVALTRAKNYLVISGFGKNQAEENNDGEATLYKKSWYYLCQRAMLELPHHEHDDGLVYGDMPAVTKSHAPDTQSLAPVSSPTTRNAGEDDWLTTKINFSYLQATPDQTSQEDKGEYKKTAAPFAKRTEATAAGEASEHVARGVAVHRLLQRLSKIPKAQQLAQAEKILNQEYAYLDHDRRQGVLDEVMATLDFIYATADKLPPDWQSVFITDDQQQIFLEQEVMGWVEGVAMMGRVDRMVVTPTEVKILDYKSSSLNIQHLSQVPRSYQQQMARYRQLLSLTYPDKKIRTALLFTGNLQLIEVF